MRGEYTISYENAHAAEPVMRDFLLSKSDKMQLTSVSRRHIGPLSVISNKKSTTQICELTEELKSKIDKEGLFFDYPNSRLFVDQEDPVFMKGDEIIGKVISHEPIVYLYLDPVEKKAFENKKVVFD